MKGFSKKLVSFAVSCTVGACCLSGVSSMCKVSAMERLNYTWHSYRTGQNATYYLSTSNVTTYSLEDTVPSQRITDPENTAVVRLNFQGGGTATGFIVGEHYIATAAHCVYNVGTGAFVNNLQVKVYNETGVACIRTVYAVEAHIPTRYITNTSNQTPYDYALIYVEEDLSQYGVMSLGVPMDSFMTSGSNVYISGYSPDYSPAYSVYPFRTYGSGSIMDSTSGVISTFDPDRQLRYNIYTSGGDSGGPLYITNSYNGTANKTVIGIHTTSNGTTGNNSTTGYATRITPELLKFYYSNTHFN